MPSHVAGLFVKNSYLAVDLFFILSGFVIQATYSRSISDRQSMLQFMGRRFFRLYPLHGTILALFLTLEATKLIFAYFKLINPGQPPFAGDNSPGTLLANIFLMQSLTGQLGWNFRSWSISCEFIAYILFGVTALTGLHRKKSFFLVGSGLAVASYCWLAIANGTLDVPRLGMARCLPGFFFGMLIFELTVGLRAIRRSARITVLLDACEIALAILVVLALSFISGATIVLVLPILMAAVLVLQTDRGPVAGLLRSNFVQYLGRISYSIYMVHAVVQIGVTIALRRLFGISMANDHTAPLQVVGIGLWRGDCLLLCTIVAVLLIGGAAYTFIEVPARGYGRRLFNPDMAQAIARGGTPVR